MSFDNAIEFNFNCTFLRNLSLKLYGEGTGIFVIKDSPVVVRGSAFSDTLYNTDYTAKNVLSVVVKRMC